MPQHRKSEVLPQKLIDKVKSSNYSEFFGNVHTILGGGLTGMRHKRNPIDIQYTLKDNILTRTEFLSGIPAIPLHMAHFDANTGKRFSTVLDCA